MSEPNMSRPSEERSRRSMAPLIGAGLIMALGYGIYAHIARDSSVRTLASERENQIPEVRTMIVHATTAPVILDLPGETAGQEAAAIGARASGYIERRLVDIGTHVKAGQVLAIIHAPELDHRVAQAKAALVQAKAALDLARLTAQRSAGLVGGGAVSKQNFDVDRLTQRARLAAQEAADAVLEETAQRQAYRTLVAPFDGVVTVRNVEVGDLAGADATSDRPLFTIVRTDKLRVRVHVPQDEAGSVHVGDPATLTVPERPSEHFSGNVTRTGNALEQDSRMLPVEIEMDNRDGRLTVGQYVTIHFALPRPSRTILVPAQAVSYEADGLAVETVASGNTITVRKVQVGRDFGDQTEILDGLPDGSQMIIHPPSALHDGSRITPQPEKGV